MDISETRRAAAAGNMAAAMGDEQVKGTGSGISGKHRYQAMTGASSMPTTEPGEQLAASQSHNQELLRTGNSYRAQLLTESGCNSELLNDNDGGGDYRSRCASVSAPGKQVGTTVNSAKAGTVNGDSSSSGGKLCQRRGEQATGSTGRSLNNGSHSNHICGGERQCCTPEGRGDDAAYESRSERPSHTETEHVVKASRAAPGCNTETIAKISGVAQTHPKTATNTSTLTHSHPQTVTKINEAIPNHLEASIDITGATETHCPRVTQIEGGNLSWPTSDTSSPAPAHAERGRLHETRSIRDRHPTCGRRRSSDQSTGGGGGGASGGRGGSKHGTEVAVKMIQSAAGKTREAAQRNLDSILKRIMTQGRRHGGDVQPDPVVVCDHDQQYRDAHTRHSPEPGRVAETGNGTGPNPLQAGQSRAGLKGRDGAQDKADIDKTLLLHESVSSAVCELKDGELKEIVQTNHDWCRKVSQSPGGQLEKQVFAPQPSRKRCTVSTEKNTPRAHGKKARVRSKTRGNGVKQSVNSNGSNLLPSKSIPQTDLAGLPPLTSQQEPDGDGFHSATTSLETSGKNVRWQHFASRLERINRLKEDLRQKEKEVELIRQARQDPGLGH